MVLDARARPRRRSRRRRANGRATAIASPTLSGVSPPARISGTPRAWLAQRAPSRSVSPVPPCCPGGRRRRGGSRSGKRRGGLDVGGAADPERLDHLAPVRRATSAQNDGPSSPWSWTIVSCPRSAASATSSRGALTNTPDDLAAALQRRADLRRDLGGRSGAGSRAGGSARPPRRRAATAASASSRLVMPQTLTCIRSRIADRRRRRTAGGATREPPSGRHERCVGRGRRASTVTLLVVAVAEHASASTSSPGCLALTTAIRSSMPSTGSPSTAVITSPPASTCGAVDRDRRVAGLDPGLVGRAAGGDLLDERRPRRRRG